MLSIIIPSWNNKPFLQLCVESINKHAAVETQVIVHVNDGSDGSLEWVKAQGLDYSYTAENCGVCTAVNRAAALARHPYIVFMNDDMYVLPGWDTELLKHIKNTDSDCFMFSGTMIEPYETGNVCVITADYGRTPENFEEKRLLAEFGNLKKDDWCGSTWPPSVVHKKWWDKVGGYSEEFSPGMSSDDDFAMKMWAAGCRIFKGVGSSKVYHFISKSTGRVVKNDGRKQFLQKWGIKQSAFRRYYLRQGQKYTRPLAEPRFNPGLLLAKALVKFTRY